ncbi:angiopoietin-2-like [Platysternon megacephalum]|uniref:Angiopoietin-2-like n=1 Tax=Platysternon megacephalum TaxID=55544 RepID=A0A4D9ER26_9SAUR|nr:angiopoietin-2-like [Platysternon megacephalum]
MVSSVILLRLRCFKNEHRHSSEPLASNSGSLLKYTGKKKPFISLASPVGRGRSTSGPGSSSNASGSNRRLQQTQHQVDEVVDIMRVNVDKVLERDQKLSELDDRADALQAGASQFETSAAKLKRKYWWKNCKMWAILIAVVLIIIIIIIGNGSFFQAMNDYGVFQTDVTTYSIEELVAVTSERTPKNTDTFVAIFSLLSGQMVHLSEQAASILNCKKKFLDSSWFVELLAPQDVSVFHTHTTQSHLPLWNMETQAGDLATLFLGLHRKMVCKDQEQEMVYYTFRITSYLVHVCSSGHVAAESCCLTLPEKIHSGYEGKSGEFQLKTNQ